MSGTGSEATWSDFWAAGGVGAESGCLPNALVRIEAAQREIWQQAVSGLRRGARVLDLATGDGAVLGKIRRTRQDLKLIGVDSARRLPPAPRGVTLRPGVQMEQLPFQAGHFDLVTSQFGIEYGDTSRIAAEVRRVLTAEGRLHFLVHYRGGPILAHNLPRREALRWASMGSDYLEKARAVAVARRTVPSFPTPAYFRQAPQEAKRLFPHQPVAEEFLTAILYTLEGSRRASPAEALEVLGLLEERAKNDVARVNALEAAACDEEQVLAFAEVLTATGLRVTQPEVVREQDSDRVFAWLVRSAQ